MRALRIGRPRRSWRQLLVLRPPRSGPADIISLSQKRSNVVLL
jgi:hypothetical protein